MCLSFRSAVEKLLDIQNDAKKWKAGPISISVATSLTDDNPKIINLSDTIGHGKYAPRKGKRNDDNRVKIIVSLAVREGIMLAK